jgi:uncharacterized repeat protein (TIGR01451 family)
MSKIFLKMSLGMVASVGLLLTVSAAAPVGMKSLSGNGSLLVSHLAPLGKPNATNRLHLSIGLPLRNREAITNLLQQINDPSSQNYHHYLTPDQFAAQFSPTEAEYQSVLDFARTNGLKVTHTHGNRMVVGVEGDVAAVERSFHVGLRTYQHPNATRNFYAPDAEPTVAANLPVLSVQGLSDYVQPRPLLNKRPASLKNPAGGSAPGGGYIGYDFRNAYIPGTTLTGAGQIVGLLQFDGYYPSDIATYVSLAGLPSVPLQNVLLDGFNGTPGVNNDEVCLDIETVIAMAPGLSKIVVFEAGPFGNPNDILSSMAASNTIKQFSASWGYGTDGTTRQLYQQLALQGQTFLNASGDGDAWVGAIPYGSCEDANITIVGGTTLQMNGQGVSYQSERAWNWGFVGGYNWNPDGYVGTSGGISTTVAIPSWQQGISMVANHGSTTMRNVPDVALTADNVFVVSSGGSFGNFGGTSCASPLFAGFMALVNQQAAANGKPSVGFLAPQVYALAKTASYTNIFHDTTVGDNTWDQSLTNFFAVAGYDLCTGLGTPNGTIFVNALTASAPTTPPTISAPARPWGTNLSVMNGSNPNGPWFLFVQDDAQFNVGTINNGWFITLTTAYPVGMAADNELTITPVNASNTPSASWPVTLSVTNYGPGTSADVYVTDTLPLPGSGVSLASYSATSGTVVRVGDTLNWTIGNLAISNQASLTLNFYTASNAFGLYTNSATVYSSTSDPNPDENVGVATLFVSGTPPPPPQLASSFIPGTGAFQLTVTSPAGQSAIIQASTNLVTGSWVPVFTNIIPFTYTNFDSTNFHMRFYRTVFGP